MLQAGLDVGSFGCRSLFSFGSGWTFAIWLFVFIFNFLKQNQAAVVGKRFSIATPAAILIRCVQYFSTMFKFITVILIFGFFACNQKPINSDTKILDFGSFTIETPKSWTKIKEQGTDSYVGKIAIDNKDTLDFDLGWYSNKLYETDVTILDSSMMNLVDTNAVDFYSIIFVKDKNLVDPDKYRKNNISWDTINGYKAKIVYPRQPGVGITGVYIDSLWQAGSDIDRFNLYGTNLKPDNEKKVLQVLQTLQFHKK